MRSKIQTKGCLRISASPLPPRRQISWDCSRAKGEAIRPRAAIADWLACTVIRPEPGTALPESGFEDNFHLAGCQTQPLPCPFRCFIGIPKDFFPNNTFRGFAEVGVQGFL